MRQEAAAVAHCANQLGEAFGQAVELILACTGRVIPCGIGKSGHIARKTAGTLSSTGTPSLFLHAAEAVHGDLGMVTGDDIVLLYSQSGETEEIISLFPALRAIGASSILITGRPASRAGHSWLTRSLMPVWFATDNVHPSPDHLPYLIRHFEQVSLDEGMAKLPYVPLLRAPYYRFVGRRRPVATG
jgi:hypothetical protein